MSSWFSLRTPSSEFRAGRRDWLRRAAFGITAGSLSGWIEALAAAESRPAKSIILLWMNGGPATIDLWDLKPGHENGGPFQEIETAAQGIKISEHLPSLAQWTKEMVLVRTMSTKEGDHGRASHLARTGYLPQAAIQFPALGALVASEIGREDADLPNFVSIAPSQYSRQLGGGFLGARFAPLAVAEGAMGPEELKVPDLERSSNVAETAQSDRLRLLAGLEKHFASDHASPVTDGLQAATARAERLMRPEAASAFRLDQEKGAVRNRYGRSLFGQGCLLARRLVERGVSFVEVTLDGWDTHANNFEQVKALSGTLDTAWAALLGDLKDRGLLDSTLIVCMGEFGRTPKINSGKGRDHWPQVWSTVMAGGGIKGGQVIGKTSADGTKVEERPVMVPDLISTVCKVVGIDPKKQNMSNVSRPIRIADVSAKPIEGV